MSETSAIRPHLERRFETTRIVFWHATGGTYFAKATPSVQASAVTAVGNVLARVGAESQIAMVLQLGSSFESTTYPALLDQLAASQVRDDDEDLSPPKQTVSVKTVAVSGVSGVLESEDDVDRYLAALRTALLAALNDGKRISL